MARIEFKAFEAVIFDLDGTLVDSMGMWKNVDRDYLSRFDIPCPADLQRELEGLSLHETALYFIRRFDLKDSPEVIKADWRQMVLEQYCYGVAMKSGAPELLHFLKKMGLRLAIASSNDAVLIRDFLKARELEDVFDVLVTCDDVKANKPDPAVYLTAAQLLKTPPEKCLVFEDVVRGIEAGKRAGMTVYAVADDWSAAQESKKRALADGWVDDFHELLPDELTT
ncbi:MAG: HAD family phosphatase [Lachnospiraceae bacterium]|nr:HAD family phosphatase [Lachnospiraceae bacterium]